MLGNLISEHFYFRVVTWGWGDGLVKKYYTKFITMKALIKTKKKTLTFATYSSACLLSQYLGS